MWQPHKVYSLDDWFIFECSTGTRLFFFFSVSQVFLYSYSALWIHRVYETYIHYLHICLSSKRSWNPSSSLNFKLLLSRWKWTVFYPMTTSLTLITTVRSWHFTDLRLTFNSMIAKRSNKFDNYTLLYIFILNIKAVQQGYKIKYLRFWVIIGCTLHHHCLYFFLFTSLHFKKVHI